MTLPSAFIVEGSSDAQGNLYFVSPGYGIMRVTPAGQVTTLPLTINGAWGVVVAGNTLYVSESSTGSIKSIDLTTNAVATFASGFAVTSGDHLSGQLARDGRGHLFVLWGIGANPGLFDITAGGDFSAAAPVAARRVFRFDVNGVAFDSSNNAFFAGDGTDTVWKSTFGGGTLAEAVPFATGISECESIAIYPVPAVPAVSVAKSGSSDVAISGGTFTYMIAYANKGGAPASSVVIRDPLPAGTTFLSATGGGTLSGSDVVWSVGTLAAQTTGSVSVTFRVDASPGAQLANQGYTIAALSVATAGGAPVTTRVVAPPALSISKTASAPAVASQSYLSYTISYANTGGVAAPNAFIEDALPSGTAFVSASDGGTLSAGTVRWTLGTVAAGAQGTVRLTLQVTAAAGATITNGSYRIAADGVAAVNGTAVTTAVAAAPTLTLSQSAAPQPVVTKGRLNFTLSFTNTGSTSASPIIEETIPPGTEFASANADGTFAGGTVRWTLATLAPGASGQVRFSLRVTAAADAVVTNALVSIRDSAGAPRFAAPLSVAVRAIAAGFGPGTILASDTFGSGGSIFDVTTGATRLFATVPGAIWVGGLTVAPNGHAYVCNGNDPGNYSDVYDITSGGDLRGATPFVRIPTTFVVEGAADDEGNLYFVSPVAGGRVAKVTPAGDVTLLPIPLNRAWGVVVADTTMYVTNAGTGSVDVVDLTTNVSRPFASGFDSSAPDHFSGQLARDPRGHLYVLWRNGRGTGVFDSSAGGNFAAADPVIFPAFSIDVNSWGFDQQNNAYFAGNGSEIVWRTTLPRGNRVRFSYEDGTNRLTDTVRLDESGNEVERRHLTLNTVGDRATEEDQSCAAPASPCTSWITKRSESFAYDIHNRLFALLHPIPTGSRTVYTYDGEGKIASIQDENHTAPNTVYGYDQLDRLTSVTQALATAPGGVAITRYDYDVMDNLTAVTDPNGNITRYAFDDFRRMTRQDSPVTNTTSYAYDPAGNLTSTTDARGATTTRTYDALDRLISTTSMLSGNAETVSFGYDDPTQGSYGKGRLRAMSDPSGSSAYAYERRGLLRSEVNTILGDSYTTGFSYDANGNRNGITYPSGRQLTYSFDYADRPLSLSGTLNSVSTPYIANATYQPFGPESSLLYGVGSMSRNITYDLRYRLTSFNVLSGTTPLADHRYGLDAVGNITAITDKLDARFSRSFGYDDLYRLTQANGGAALWGTGSYTYDSLGNRLTAALGPKTSSYTYVGMTSKLAAVTEKGATRSVAYDAAGNEQQVGSSTFVYSPRNHLDQADGLRYLYDGSGVRVAQVGLAVGPLITAQPQSQSVCPGGAATLTVVASGATAYQWQSFDGTIWNNISGATSSSVVVSPSAPTQYRVIASNAASSTTSNPATVTPIAVATEPKSGILYGDVNHDGTVDANDVALLRGVLAGKQALAVPNAVADLNGDGAIDAVDLALLGAYAAHTITCLPQFPASSTTLSSRLKPTSLSVAPNQIASNPTQYFFYTPEKNLLSQTEIKAAGGKPQLAIDYVWFGGHPVAEERLASGSTRFTFTDHLGTPFLQTDGSATPLWRAEYEPFGAVHRMRTGSASDQRLRFPGQEDDGSSDRSYNIFRWYRSGWGRYSQADPFGITADLNLYAYAGEDPLGTIDPMGLAPAVPRGDRRPCGMDDWRYCEQQCGGRRVNGCQTYWAPRMRTRNIRGTVLTTIEWSKTHVECNCDDSREECISDRVRRWLDEFRRWLENDRPPIALPPIMPRPLPVTPAPNPRGVPGLPPFFVNPCMLNPSLCFGPGGPA